MDTFLKPIDFSGMVGYPHDISEDVIENMYDFHNYDDVSAHIRAFGRCIDEWLDPPIYEDVLMKLFYWTLCEGYACDWFLDYEDNTFNTIHGLLHAFLERFGDDQDETYKSFNTQDNITTTHGNRKHVSFQVIIAHLVFDIITTTPTFHCTTISYENLKIRN
jgi:hypothetical protein